MIFYSQQIHRINANKYFVFIGFSEVTSRIIEEKQAQHYFQQKTVVVQEICFVCEKKIKFGKTALKCKACKAIYHTECKQFIFPLCLNADELLNIKKTESLSYYASLETPMVPNIIINCINKIETRGLTEEGIYRITGNVKEIKGKNL